jgi:hypothetical protein
MFRDGASEGEADLRVAELRAASTAREELSGYPPQRIVESISDSIEEILDSDGITIPDQYFVGAYPSPDVASFVVSIPEGLLILVNAGMLMVLYEMAKAISSSFVPADTRAEEIPGHQAPQRNMATIIAAYLRGGDANPLPSLPIPSGDGLVIVSHLVENAERFAVAHEYSHLLAGHDGAGCAPFSNGLPWPQIEEKIGTRVSVQWRREFEADAVAAMITLPPRLKAGGLEAALAVASPFFFFAVDDMIRICKAACAGLPPTAKTESHPSSGDRANVIRLTFGSLTNEPVDTSIGDQLLSYFASQVDSVAELVKRENGVKAQPDPQQHLT